MKYIIFLILYIVLIGCDSQEKIQENANRVHQIETKVNEEALKNNPPPNGEGPSY